MNKITLPIALAALFSFMVAQPLAAADYTSVANGFWNNAATWSAGAPAAGPRTGAAGGDNAFIDGGFTVTYPGSTGTGGSGGADLVIARGNSVTINNGSTLLRDTGPGNWVRIGEGPGTGTLNINDGTYDQRLGNLAVGVIGGTGVINVGDGTGAAGSALLAMRNSAGDLSLGRNVGAPGQGHIVVNSDGRILVENDWFHIGQYAGTGQSTVTVNAGGVLDHGADAAFGGGQGIEVGRYAGADGLLDINGGTLNQGVATTGGNRLLIVGHQGDAAMQVRAGGVVNKNRGEFWVGLDATGTHTGEVTVDGGTINLGPGGTNNVEMTVGRQGNGDLRIINGGSVFSNDDDFRVGQFSTGNGRVLIENGGLLQHAPASNRHFQLGQNGTGLVFVGAGGTLTSSTTNQLGNAASGNGTLFVDGGTVTYTGPETNVGLNGTGTINLASGTISSSGQLNIANNAGSTGSITQAGGTLTQTNVLRVGRYGDGSYTIGGGTLNASSNIEVGTYAGSSGAFTIADTGTVNSTGGEINVGWFGTDATLTVDGAGALLDKQAGLIRVGREVGSNGTVNVANGGTINLGPGGTNSVEMNVGFRGTGTLNITSGGSVLSNDDDFRIGQASTANGTVNISDGGLLQHAPPSNRWFLLGQDGTGVINVDTGGTFTNNSSLQMGYSAAGNGTLNVDGGTVTLANPDSNVGLSGTGTINLSAGTITSSGQLNIANNAGSTGTINQSGGTFTQGNVMRLGHRASGTYNLSGGTMNMGSRLEIGVHAGSTGELNITGDGLFNKTAGDTMVGWLAGGEGTINVDGPGAVYQHSGGGLFIGYSGGDGTVNVTNGGSVIRPNGDIRLGQSGGSTGNLNINSGGTVTHSANDFRIGFANGSTGTVTVEDGGVLNHTPANWFWVGQNGDGVLNVGEGGTVNTTSSNFMRIGYGSTSTGTINQTGGTINANNVTLGSAGGSATLNLSNGSFNTSLNLDYNGGGINQISLTNQVLDVAGGFWFDDNVVGSTLTVNGSGNDISTGSFYIQGGNNEHIANFDARGISAIEAGGNVTLAAGSTITFDDSALGVPSTTESTTISTATVWDSSDAGWDHFNPGTVVDYYTTGDQVDLVTAGGNLTDNGVVAGAGSSANWTLNTATGAGGRAYLEATTNLDRGPIAAVIDLDPSAGDTVTRATNLDIRNEFGADATRLTIANDNRLALTGGATLLVSNGGELTSSGASAKVNGGTTIVGAGGSLTPGGDGIGRISFGQESGAGGALFLGPGSVTTLGIAGALGTIPGAEFLSGSAIEALIPLDTFAPGFALPTLEHDHIGAISLNLSSTATIALENIGGATFAAGDYFDLFTLGGVADPILGFLPTPMTGVAAADLPGILDFSALGLDPSLEIDTSLFLSEGILFVKTAGPGPGPSAAKLPFAPVPEPSQGLLLALGIAAGLLRRRR